ncbi:hypothetical protein GZL_06910 [Streptomyces sp. 769]|nr:hypothetical protein GZL_06910 [Streptomyces sp. 769]
MLLRSNQRVNLRQLSVQMGCDALLLLERRHRDSESPDVVKGELDLRPADGTLQKLVLTFGSEHEVPHEPRIQLRKVQPAQSDVLTHVGVNPS